MHAGIWQDRVLRFDLKAKDFLVRPGEEEIDSINSVEDTKGNNGIRGSLAVTNLRILWCSHKSTRINLSIGLGCVQKLKIRAATSKLRGSTQALYVLAHFEEVKYEFIFTSLVNSSPRLYTTVQAVHRAYDTSRLYRELKLRGAIIRDGALKTLPDEEILDRIKGTWNLSSDQGNLGTFVITNIRVVWFSEVASNFNVSIPYLQVKSVRTKSSKFGEALVLETSRSEGSYVLGFKIDPLERLEQVREQVESLHSLLSHKPNFGVRFSFDAVAKPIEQITEKRVEEDVDIIDDYDDLAPCTFAARQGKAAYISEPAPTDDADAAVLPEYCADLGCATQRLRPGTSITSLWTL